MAVDAATFIQEYPEFADVYSANPVVVTRALRNGAQFVSAIRFADRYQDGVFLKAAHILSMSPFGESSRLAKGSKETTYSVQFDDMIAALPVRMLVT